MSELPVQFRKSSETQPQFDYFDAFSGVGYITLYLAGEIDDSTQKYFLTQDSSVVSDTINARKTDLGTTEAYDFDLDVDEVFTIADGEAVLSHLQQSNGNQTTQVTYTLYRVDSAGTEHQIGTQVAGATIASSSTWEKKTARMTVTRTTLGRGDKLRLEASVQIGSTGQWHFDPSGSFPAQTDSLGRSLSSTALIKIPIIIPI